MKNKFHLNPVLIFLILLANFQFATAQKLDKKLDALISEAYPSDEPGATVIVAKEGNILYNKAFGMANLELNLNMKPEMVLEIGSITKQFTAVSILMLMEEGKLALDDAITIFIDDFPTHGHSITIHHLLTHTSGIRSYTSISSIMEKGRLDYRPEELINLFKNEPMDFAPGEKFLYNNSAYFLLGYIIEKISGMSYPEFISKRIFDPLGLENTYYGSQQTVINNRAAGYQKNKGAFVNAEYLSLTVPYSAGSIMSTAEDLLKWNTAVQNYKLISKESMEKALTNYALNNGDPINYGYGWFLSKIHGSPTYEHGGGIYGYTCNGIYLPEEKVYVAMMTNRDDKGPGVLSTRIAAIAIGKPYPDEKDRIDLDPDKLKALVGVYEFEDGTIRYIRYEEDKLFSQRRDGQPFEIYPVSDSEFGYIGSISSIVFKATSEDEITVVFRNRISETNGKRTSREIPEEEEKEKSKEEVEVPLALMKKFVGEYVVNPSFSIKVFLEGENLFGQATNQPKFRMYPSSQSRFYLKIVEAEIEFYKNSEGVYDSMTLFQGGAEIKGKKKL